MTKMLGAIQGVAALLQGAPDLTKTIPEEYHPVWHFVLAIIQFAGWWSQRNYNPDGTPAATGYIPKKSKQKMFE